MNITLYNTTDKPNVLNKTLTELSSRTNVKPIPPFSLRTPTLLLAKNATLLTANYCYIEEFNRYYFIDDITINEEGHFEMTLRVDVLESNKDEILAYNGIIDRQEYDYNLYLEDSEIKAYQDTEIVYKNFPNTPFESTIGSIDKKFILITTSD